MLVHPKQAAYAKPQAAFEDVVGLETLGQGHPAETGWTGVTARPADAGPPHPGERLAPLGQPHQQEAGMGMMIEQRLSSDAEVRRVAVLELAEDGDEDQQPLLIAALDDPVAAVRPEAALAQEACDSFEAVSGLVARLDDPDQAVARAAARSLAELRSAEAAEWLLPALQDASAGARAPLLRALRELRSPASSVPASALLDDPSPEVRRKAISVLAYLRHPPALGRIAALAREDACEDVRRAAVGALAYGGDRDEVASVPGRSDARPKLARSRRSRRRAGQEPGRLRGGHVDRRA